MRARLYGTLIAIASVSLVSCTALLGLSDKTFDGTGGSGGSGGSGGAVASSAATGGAGGGVGPGSTVWATKTSGSPADTTKGPEVGGIAVDPNGNIWVTGTYQDTLQFDNCNILNAAGNRQAFWAQFDKTGQCMNSQTVGGLQSETWGKAIAVDGGGNAVIVGKFSGTLTLPKLPPMVGMLEDVFVLKLDRLGILVWIQHFSSASNDGATDVAIINIDEILVGGTYGDILSIPTMSSLAPAGAKQDMFLLKLDPLTGIPNWKLGVGSLLDDSLHGISVTKNGRVGFTGSIGGMVNVLDKQMIGPMAGSKLFAAVLETHLAKCSYAYTGDDQPTTPTGRDVTLDASETHLAVVGEVIGASSDPLDGFAASLPLMPGTIQQLVLGPPSATATDYMNAIAVDPRSGNDKAVIVGSAGLGAMFQSKALTTPGNTNIFISKLTPTFTDAAVWTHTFGTAGHQAEARAVAIDPTTGEVIVAGVFDGSLDLGGAMVTAAPNKREVFVMKMLP